MQHTHEDIAVRCDFPEKIPINGRLVYLRKESVLTEYQQKKAITYLRKPILPVVQLLLAIQDALLGKVTAALREVSVSMDEKIKKLSFYFVYDGEILQEDFDLANLAIHEACRSFAGFALDKHIYRLDYPEEIRNEGQRTAFSRYEGPL